MKKSRKKKEQKILILMGSLLVCASFPGQTVAARSSGSKTVCEKWQVSLNRAVRQETLEVSEMETENETDMNAETESETEYGLEAEFSQNAEAEMESGESEERTESEQGAEAETGTENGQESGTESNSENGQNAEPETGTENGQNAETEAEPDSERSAGAETEAESSQGAGIETEAESSQGVETETEMESGQGAETETESESGRDAKNETEAESGQSAETDNGLEAEIWRETEIENGLETETGAEAENGMGEVYADDSVFTVPSALSDAIAHLTGIEMETEVETETEMETETETETETEDESELAIWAFLEEIQLGADFQIPMAMPDELGTLDGPVTYSCGRLSVGRAKRVHAWQQEHTMEALEKLVQSTIEAYDGTWSVYVKNLNTDESFVINDQPMKSASVMKLFIMGTVYEAIEDGELERTDEIMSLMNAMISYSDNASSNQLLYILGDSSYADGIAKVNEFIQSHGYSEMTVEYNGFSNDATNSGNGINQVAARDVGQLLEDIYRRTWMSRAVSNEMEEMLLDQHTRTKIPAGLPDDVLCANKTGEMSGTENDVAIIYSDACDYILVVLTNDVSDSGKTITRIASLSEMVYEFFN